MYSLYYAVLVRISPGYPPVAGWFHTRYSPVRRSPPIEASFNCAAPRLACVRPVASVHPEPGSNSSLYYFFFLFLFHRRLFRLLPFCRKAAHDSPVLTLTFTRLVLLCLSFLQRSFRFPRSGWPPFPLQIFLRLFLKLFSDFFSSPYPSAIYTRNFFPPFFNRLLLPRDFRPSPASFSSPKKGRFSLSLPLKCAANWSDLGDGVMFFLRPGVIGGWLVARHRVACPARSGTFSRPALRTARLLPLRSALGRWG